MWSSNLVIPLLFAGALWDSCHCLISKSKIRDGRLKSEKFSNNKSNTEVHSKSTKKARKERNRAILPPGSYSRFVFNSLIGVGYVIGDLDRLNHVYDLLAGNLSMERLLESRYLRYWSGRNPDLRKIWVEMVDSPEHIIKHTQLPKLLHKLDEVTERVRLEMEQESIAWMEQDLQHDMLVKFFSTNSKEGELSFQKFINWETVKSEIWYNNKSISVESISQKWSRVAGSTEGNLDFNQFCALYEEICSAEYVA